MNLLSVNVVPKVCLFEVLQRKSAQKVKKLGEITFANRPADFPKLVTKVKKCNTDAKTIVFGLENAYGYGRALAGKDSRNNGKYIVKF